LSIVSSWQSELSPEDITIAVGDPETAPHIKDVFEHSGIAIRDVTGESMIRTRPALLLCLLEDFLRHRTYRTFASLLRHPDVLSLIARENNISESSIISASDRFFDKTLPFKFENLQTLGHADEVFCISATTINNIIDPLSGPERSMAEWAERTSELLRRVYKDVLLSREVPDERLVVDACGLLFSLLIELLEITSSIVKSEDALSFITWKCREKKVVPEMNNPAVDVIGWLDICFDDAAAVVICGLNEGRVPEVINAHQFLPNNARRALGLTDNSFRLAREDYYLSALTATRSMVGIIAGRRSEEGNPLALSRMLLTKWNIEKAAKVVSMFYEGETNFDNEDTIQGLKFAQEWPPKPSLTASISEVSVTSIKDYLACPYRFYLKHVLRLGEFDDSLHELDPLKFGSIAHDILAKFSRSDVALSSSASEIKEFLFEQVDLYNASHFGDGALAAVYLQLEILKERFALFSEWQANWRAQGWRIEHTELALPREVCRFSRDSASIDLRGRIDRIDIHEATNERILFDYKTGNLPQSPEQTHRNKKEWVDIQLPLYESLLGKAGIVVSRLGFIPLSADQNQMLEPMFAEWSREDLCDAISVVERALVGILRGVFWPPRDLNRNQDELYELLRYKSTHIDGVF
ncbi:MAG: PD-(D/E)XK nuclease family protein, partial [Bdellovibrionales bacterium]|nr:PD-(D/E)XK nuclease family protein [Bdellovibrionales bacterium]